MKKKVILFRITTIISLILLMLYLFLCLFYLHKVSRSEYIYAGFLKSRMILSCSIFTSLLFLFWVVCVILVKKREVAFLNYWIIVIWILFICLVFTYGFSLLQKQYLDVSKEDYVVYEGEFEKDHTRSFLFLRDEKRTRLENVRNETFIEKGQYKGHIIYSKRTKYVLEIMID